MKKLSLLFLGFVVATVSLWAVWEGNAGVGRADDFTSGTMTVRSDMFPKNTFIEIENLENGKKTTAFVGGNSGIPGLLVHLSPEVAAALEIPADKIVRVRIDITSKLTDDFSEGDKYLSDDADYNPALAAVTPSISETATPYTDSDTVLFDPASTTAFPRPKEPMGTVPEEPTVIEPLEEPVKPVAAEKAYLEKAGLKPPLPQTTTKTTETKTETVTVITQPVATVPPVEDKPTTPEPAEPVQPPITPVPVQPVLPKPVTTVGGITQPEKPQAESAKPVTTVGGITQPEKPKAESAKPVTTVGGITQPEKPQAEPTKPVSAIDGITQPEKPKAEPTKSVSTVDGITPPVPEVTKPKSMQPVITKKTDDTPITTVQTVTTETTTQTIPKVTIVDEPEQPIVNKIADKEIEEYVVSDDAEMYKGSLQKGKYYLQIANYSKESNVRRVLSEHKAYPLVVVKTGTGSRTRYKVFVGPLQQDEMGAAMEQFYTFGFKDSFFKVIK